MTRRYDLDYAANARAHLQRRLAAVRAPDTGLLARMLDLLTGWTPRREEERLRANLAELDNRRHQLYITVEARLESAHAALPVSTGVNSSDRTYLAAVSRHDQDRKRYTIMAAARQANSKVTQDRRDGAA